MERSNLTLQDRLVKELRLRGICDMAAGQAYLPEFRADYNRRFGRPPRNAYDAHRPVDEHVAEIFTLQEERCVSENLTLSYQRTLYVVDDTLENRRLRGHRVMVHEDADGGITLRQAGRARPSCPTQGPGPDHARRDRREPAPGRGPHVDRRATARAGRGPLGQPADHVESEETDTLGGGPLGLTHPAG